MPTYDLTCRSCGHRFEKFVMRILRDGEAVCPECESKDVVRGIGGGVIAGISRESASVGQTSCGSGRFS